MTHSGQKAVEEASAARDAPLPGARAAVALLLGINMLNYVDRQVLAAVESPIQRTLFPHAGTDDAHVLWLMGALPTAFLISYMVTAPIFGWLADRTSRWMLVGIGVLVWSLASGGSGLAPTFAFMMLSRIFVGVGEAGYGPAAPTIISDLYPVRRRGTVLAWFYMAIPFGSALGYALGSAIGGWFGWRAAFAAVVPPGILLGILALLHKDPPRGASDAVEANVRATPRDYLQLLKIRSYLLDTAGMAAMTFAIGGISYWMPHYIVDVRHVGTLATTGLWFGAITAAAGITATLLGGIAGDWLRQYMGGAYFFVSAMGILISCPLVVLMLYTPFPLAWALIFLAEFWLFFNTGPSNTILANVTHPSVRATGFALNIFLIHALGDAASPPILGEIAGRLGWNAAFGWVAATMALGGILWLIGIPYLAGDTEAAIHRRA